MNSGWIKPELHPKWANNALVTKLYQSLIIEEQNGSPWFKSLDENLFTFHELERLRLIGLITKSDESWHVSRPGSSKLFQTLTPQQIQHNRKLRQALGK